MTDVVARLLRLDGLAVDLPRLKPGVVHQARRGRELRHGALLVEPEHVSIGVLVAGLVEDPSDRLVTEGDPARPAELDVVVLGLEPGRACCPRPGARIELLLDVLTRPDDRRRILIEVPDLDVELLIDLADGGGLSGPDASQSQNPCAVMLMKTDLFTSRSGNKTMKSSSTTSWGGVAPTGETTRPSRPRAVALRTAQ